MKQFIVLLAVLPLLLIFLLQFSLEQENSRRLTLLQSHVAAAKEVARQDGCFTSETVEELKTKIASDFDLEESDIEIQATSSPRYRINYFDEREMIDYRISVPIRQLMAGNRFFGISDANNQGFYLVEGTIASERIHP